MGHIWISMARFVKIFFLDSLSLCGYFMLRSTMALTPTYQDSWEGGQSKSSDHSEDLGRIWKGFLNKRAFNKQTTSRDWWCVNGKFHHDCAIMWLDEFWIKNLIDCSSNFCGKWNPFGACVPSATCWILRVFVVGRKFSCLRGHSGWENLAPVDSKVWCSKKSNVWKGNGEKGRIGVISGWSQLGGRCCVALVALVTL